MMEGVKPLRAMRQSASNPATAGRWFASPAGRRPAPAFVLAVALCAIVAGRLGSSPALSATDQQQPPKRPTFAASTDLVLLTVSVRDPHGAPVIDLQRMDFIVLEDGVEQRIEHFDPRTDQLSVALLLDTSSSMKGMGIHEAKRAAISFIDRSPAGAEHAVIWFNDVVGVAQAFTGDRVSAKMAVDQLEPGGGTALYDALLEAYSLMPRAAYARQAVLLLSDGQDEGSRRHFSDVSPVVEASQATLYAIGSYAEAQRRLFLTGRQYYREPEFEHNLNPVWILEALARVSGGKALFPKPGDDLTAFFASVALDLEHQYLIGYTSKPDPAGPRIRSIEVLVRPYAQTQPLTIRTRTRILL